MTPPPAVGRPACTTAAVGLWCALLVLTAGCSGSSEDPPEPAGSEGIPRTEEPGIRFSVDATAPAMVVLDFRGEDLSELLADDLLRGDLLDEAFRGSPAATRFGLVPGRGQRVRLGGVLPDNQSRNLDMDCSNLAFAAVDQLGAVLVTLAPGLCGMEHSQLAVEFGADGVEIADERFIDDPPGSAAPGTVAIDHRASRRFLSGASVEVVLVPVPEEEIAPRPDEREWEPLREFVCFDVTVHAGATGPEGQVVPEVVVSQGGQRVVIAAPAPQDMNGFPAPVIAQDPDSAVVWSFGPIDFGLHQPDEITVTATEGEITSWDVSARHC